MSIRSRSWALGALAGVLPALIIPAAAWAWGQNGHRIVGEIAQRHLSAEAERQIAVILDGDSLAEVSTWPDDIRSDPLWARVAGPWHFVSIDDGETLAMTARSADGDVLEALGRMEAVLRDPAASRDQKAEALRFYVHFAGDIHQPLHVGRRADRGGNTIMVLWFREEKNLHSVWDSGLIDSENLSFVDFARFIDDPSIVEIARWQADPYEEWARESFCWRPKVYDFGEQRTTEPGALPELGYRYAYVSLPIVRQRLLQGGVRLAGRLNAIFAGIPGPPPPTEIPTDPAVWCAG